MEVYDFGLEWMTFYQGLALMLATPVALLLGFEFGMLMLGVCMRWFREIR